MAFQTPIMNDFYFKKRVGLDFTIEELVFLLAYITRKGRNAWRLHASTSDSAHLEAAQVFDGHIDAIITELEVLGAWDGDISGQDYNP